MQSLVLIILLFGIFGTLARPPQKIVNGIRADSNEFPYQVSLRINGFHKCGGSILDETHVVTAAHCIMKNGQVHPDLAIMSGTNKAYSWFPNVYPVKSAHPHKDYDPKRSHVNDIAILTLGRNIIFNKYEQPIKLPSADTPEGTPAILSGWGVTKFQGGLLHSPLYLRKLKTQIISESTCQQYLNKIIYPQHICTFKSNGTGACSGDSGSPLAYKNELIGIASWVIPCGKGYPDVFTRIHSFVPWIQSILKSGQ